MENTNRVSAIGFWASAAAAVETVVFAASLIAGLTVRMSPTLDYVASILLAPTVVVVMAMAYSRAPESRRVYGLLALVSAIIYAPFCMSTYFLQLAIVMQNPLNLSPALLQLLAFVPGSPTFAIDMLGYVFLCISTLWVAPALVERKDRALRVLCVIHGFLAIPTVLAPLMSGMYRDPSGESSAAGSWVNLFWCLLFAPIAILFAVSFRRQMESVR